MEFLESLWTGIKLAFSGAPMTLFVSLLAVLIGSALGLCLALMRKSEHKFIVTLVKIYVEVVRGTPLVVQALILAYGVPIFLQSQGLPFRWSELVVPAIIVCGCNSAAYMAEVIRGGIQAVDKGQIEAAESLGMSKAQVNRFIVLPQAFRIVIPSLGNEFITLIKETAVLSYCGVTEILRSAAIYSAGSYKMLEAYIGAAIVYLVFTYPLSKGVQKLEKRLSQEVK